MDFLIKGNIYLVGFYCLDDVGGVNDSSFCRNLLGFKNDMILGLGYIGELDIVYRFCGILFSYVWLLNNGKFKSNFMMLLIWFNVEILIG